MSDLVIDASVAAKWFLISSEEQLQAQSLSLLDRAIRGEVAFFVPDLFWSEIGNVVLKAVRQGRLSAESARKAIETASGLPVTTIQSYPILSVAYEIATVYGRSFYDSIYVASAQTLRAQLITADQRLANATAAHLPVKWLGAFS